ncbi:MAG: right-handed parallel beta-helix repeat-containing protein [Actinomycetota bacterium]|nr:right-handed parallel beta-helix repeat-containing protein [Actinomycetota bacterium]
MRFSRVIGLASIIGLALLGIVGVSPASAANKTIHCGNTISGNVTANNSIGPCPGGDGLKISAPGTVLNLNGHSIQCSNFNNHVKREQVGIHLIGASNVTVKNGTVYDCDAGVAIEGGSNNTVSGITAHDNVAHVLVSGPVNPDNPLTTPCNFGDGITTLDSSGNHITGNITYRNGPFSGISLVGASSSNNVTGNQSYENDVSNALPPPAAPDTSGPCGPFSATPQGQGRLHQDIGIRVEGPGATNNSITGNQANNNQLNGISIHGYVCFVGITPPPGAPPVGTSNSGNQVVGNSVSGNGFSDNIDGIGILSQGPLGTVTCGSDHNTIVGNISSGNARDGIFVAATGDNSKPSSNTINANLTDGNGRDGVHLASPFTVCPIGQGNSTPPNFCNVPREPRNGANNNTLISNNGHNNGGAIALPAHGHDGYDGNPACDNNNWVANIFGTVNQACVAANGGTGAVIP